MIKAPPSSTEDWRTLSLASAPPEVVPSKRISSPALVPLPSVPPSSIRIESPTVVPSRRIVWAPPESTVAPKNFWLVPTLINWPLLVCSIRVSLSSLCSSSCMFWFTVAVLEFSRVICSIPLDSASITMTPEPSASSVRIRSSSLSILSLSWILWKWSVSCSKIKSNCMFGSFCSSCVLTTSCMSTVNTLVDVSKVFTVPS